MLASDVILTPVEQLSTEVRQRSECVEGDIALTRPHSRASSVIIGSATLALLEEFRKPKTIVEAVLSYSRANNMDPTLALEDAFPVISQLIASRMLIGPGENLPEKGGPSLKPGSHLCGAEILACIQALEDIEVYRVRFRDGTPAVIKISHGTNESVVKTLEHEARVLERLDGKLSPRFLGTAKFGDRFCLVMSWCPGTSCSVVADELRATGPRAAAKLLRLSHAIAHCYADLHASGVIHGDVHPRNILVDANGAVKLIDFGLAHDLAAEEAPSWRPRGGVGFFFDPEFAQARIAGSSPDSPTVLGEQYSIGALLYLLMTGTYYLDFSLEDSKVMREIVAAPMISFAKRDLPDWPELENVIARALAKSPANRHTSVGVLAEKLDSLAVPDSQARSSADAKSGDGTACKHLLTRVLGRLRPDGLLFRDGLSPAPTCSFNYGALGVAYALWRIASLRDDSEMLALADRWLHHARKRSDSDRAYYNGEFRVTPETVGRASLFHGAAGLHVVDALISGAIGDLMARDRAIREFVAIAQSPCRQIDLTLGRSGILVGASLLLEELDPGDREARSLLVALGNEIKSELCGALATFGAIRTASRLDYLGIAHGWAGVLYALLRWAQAAAQSVNEPVEARLAELAACGQPTGRGLCWPTRTLAADPEGAQGFLAGWCNGSAGFVHLWTLAGELSGSPNYLMLAERSGWNTWERQDRIRSLCCGLAGRAYALLNLFHHTSDRQWLDRARVLMHRGAGEGGEENPFENSLYKGDMGIALLVAEMEDPEHAVMPMFESHKRQGSAELDRTAAAAN